MAYSLAENSKWTQKAMNENQGPNTNTYMEKFAQKLLAEMYSSLQKASAESENYLQLAKQCFEIAESANLALKEFIRGHQFKDDQEEIRFFKIIKPPFLKEMIYYMELYQLEANKPVGSADNLQEYYLTKQRFLSAFFDNNRDIYNYHRLAKSHLDQYFYLRREVDPQTPSLYNLEMDVSFSTPYSHSLATILAFEQLQVYLAQAIAGELQGPVAVMDSNVESASEIQWNSSEAWFGEFIMVLYYSGVVQFEGSLNKFVTRMESMFNKKVNNIYRLAISMSMRKKDRTPLMNHFIHTMERKYDEKDL